MSGPGAGHNQVSDALTRLPAPEALLAEDVLEHLDSLDTTELRRARSACEAAEEGISYARRLLQGRLDILRARLDERDEPQAGRLLAALPSLLADEGHVADPAQARATRVRVPADADRYSDLIDAVIAEDDLPSLDGDDLEDLERVTQALTAVERELSARRRALFARIDAVRAELVARYKDGRADVRDLLE
ncbi:MAG: hypothetical protein ACQEUI_03510 [Actinomycetota bacterium]